MIGPLLSAWVLLTLPANGPATSTESAMTLVDLNTADKATLCTLPGIGPKKAEGILALREKRPITRVTQLLQVRGIGVRIVQRLQGRVTLRPASTPASNRWAAMKERQRWAGSQQEARAPVGVQLGP
jgi:competence ComEA-like helix-hairpin-helix protein